MIDISTLKPGKMGWGLPMDSIVTTTNREKKEYEALANAHPQLVQGREPRPIYERWMKKVKDLMAADGIEDGFSCRYIEKAVLGDFIPWKAQIIGSCVASGNMRAITRRCMIESFILNEPEEIFGTSHVGPNNFAPFAPYSYGYGRMLGGMSRGDGSYCSVHIRGQQEGGILLCSTPGLKSDTFPEPQNAALYRQWGSSRSLIQQYSDTAKKIKLLESEKITSAGQGKEVCTLGLKPFMVCSSWAFTPDYVHPKWKLADGSPVVIYKRDMRTSWAHNMTIDGFILFEGKWYVLVDNSWGPNAHKNGSFFIIPIELYDDWCRVAEQMSTGDVDMSDNPHPVAA